MTSLGRISVYLGKDMTQLLMAEILPSTELPNFTPDSFNLSKLVQLAMEKYLEGYSC